MADMEQFVFAMPMQSNSIFFIACAAGNGAIDQ